MIHNRHDELIMKLLQYTDPEYRGWFSECGFSDVICNALKDCRSTLEFLDTEKNPLKLDLDTIVWRTMHCCLPYEDRENNRQALVWYQEKEVNSDNMSKWDDPLDTPLIGETSPDPQMAKNAKYLEKSRRLDRILSHHNHQATPQYSYAAVCRFFIKNHYFAKATTEVPCQKKMIKPKNNRGHNDLIQVLSNVMIDNRGHNDLIQVLSNVMIFHAFMDTRTLLVRNTEAENIIQKLSLRHLEADPEKPLLDKDSIEADLEADPEKPLLDKDSIEAVFDESKIYTLDPKNPTPVSFKELLSKEDERVQLAAYKSLEKATGLLNQTIKRRVSHKGESFDATLSSKKEVVYDHTNTEFYKKLTWIEPIPLTPPAEYDLPKEFRLDMRGIKKGQQHVSRLRCYLPLTWGFVSDTYCPNSVLWTELVGDTHSEHGDGRLAWQDQRTKFRKNIFMNWQNQRTRFRNNTFINENNEKAEAEQWEIDWERWTSCFDKGPPILTGTECIRDFLDKKLYYLKEFVTCFGRCESASTPTNIINYHEHMVSLSEKQDALQREYVVHMWYGRSLESPSGSRVQQYTARSVMSLPYSPLTEPDLKAWPDGFDSQVKELIRGMAFLHSHGVLHNGALKMHNLVTRTLSVEEKVEEDKARANSSIVCERLQSCKAIPKTRRIVWNVPLEREAGLGARPNSALRRASGLLWESVSAEPQFGTIEDEDMVDLEHDELSAALKTALREKVQFGIGTIVAAAGTAAGNAAASGATEAEAAAAGEAAAVAVKAAIDAGSESAAAEAAGAAAGAAAAKGASLADAASVGIAAASAAQAAVLGGSSLTAIRAAGAAAGVAVEGGSTADEALLAGAAAAAAAEVAVVAGASLASVVAAGAAAGNAAASGATGEEAAAAGKAAAAAALEDEDMKHDELSPALKTAMSVSFTDRITLRKSVWEKLDISELYSNHFAMVGGVKYRPIISKYLLTHNGDDVFELEAKQMTALIRELYQIRDKQKIPNDIEEFLAAIDEDSRSETIPRGTEFLRHLFRTHLMGSAVAALDS